MVEAAGGWCVFFPGSVDLMATLAFAVAGAALGGAALPAGLTMFGATMSGAALGSQIGALAGHFVDQSLFGASGQTRLMEGPRLRDLHVTASSEGAVIPRIYGRARTGGQIIWATDFEEEVVTTAMSGGGGGKGAGLGGPSTQATEYRYYANFAVGLCEGEIGGIGRIWIDGTEADLSRITYRLHKGTESQLPDSLIAARIGKDSAPAFRGTAYIVFERLPLASYGNRIPQLSFEVYRPVEAFGDQVRGVVLVPGSGEFALSPQPVAQVFGGGRTKSENSHTRQGVSDWSVALDQMQEALPNARSVSLVVSWFGTDLRAVSCRLLPGVETTDKETEPDNWSVAGVDRGEAYLVSRHDGRPAYGGTPSDASVISAIRDLRSRGLSVVLNPFILMDVAADNALPDPYGSLRQSAYPWRGRITVHPAAGRVGSPDMTPAAASQIAVFMGTAAPAHFVIASGAVSYSGPPEWSYRRMILHCAALAAASGGVDAFLIGSELRGLTTARSGLGIYPFVTALAGLAADVKAILGASTKVLYAADWSEYFGHHPSDGSGDINFHLDPLWASASIDAIGLDLYWPLSDWRDGSNHADAVAGAKSIYDLDYLRSNVSAGEGFDWYYANAMARDSQQRMPITDALGKPWIYRFKDLKSWWLNYHYNRHGGLEAASPTSWVPQSKPFWVMEVGCPAIDRGANQPNVFVDPKSAESFIPYFSRGGRDDLMQRRYLRAFIEAFDPAGSFGGATRNPSSAVYGGRMVDIARVHVYCWDARPYPAFPFDTATWGDGDNWRLGHWISGRLAAGPLAETVKAILDDYGFSEHETDSLVGVVPGYVIDRLMSAREALQPLELAYFIDTLETGGRIVMRQRGQQPAVAELSQGDLVETKPGSPLLSVTRAQETDLPASVKLSFISATSDYAQAVAEGRRLAGASGRVAEARIPVVLEPEAAGVAAEIWLFEAWSAREKAAFSLPPSLIAVEPGDSVLIGSGSGARLLRITEVDDHGARDCMAASLDPAVYGTPPAAWRTPRLSGTVDAGRPLVVFLDLPRLRDSESGPAGYFAAAQSPWRGPVAALSSPAEAGFRLRATANAPAIIGQTTTSLAGGATSRLDHATRLQVSIGDGELTSVETIHFLAGRNAAAVRNADGDWEVLQFRNARLLATGQYELTEFLRGQAGTERAMRAAVPAGAPFVLLDEALARIELSASEIGAPLNWRYGPASRDIGDATFVTRTLAFSGVGLKPLSPCHVKGQRTGGDLVITWIRRTREGGDAWEAAEVPFGETVEAYAVDILDVAGSVKRTLTASTQSAVYTQAQQMADFGQALASCSVRISQMSSVWGRGFATTATL